MVAPVARAVDTGVVFLGGESSLGTERPGDGPRTGCAAEGLDMSAPKCVSPKKASRR